MQPKLGMMGAMIAFLNGEFVAEERAMVSVLDRGFLYGDGLFEGVRIYNGKLFKWLEHFARLERGAGFLRIRMPGTEKEMRGWVEELVRRNEMKEALARVTLSRGVGLRGYSPKGAERPTIVITLHPAPGAEEKPPEWSVRTASFRLPANEALAQWKTCNKLPQILARAEAEATGADEALLLNTQGEVVEGASSNLFWVQDGMVCTPPLVAGILEGVTRGVVLELCGRMGVRVRETGITPAELTQVEGVFLSLSSWGVVQVVEVDGEQVRRSELVGRLQQAYAEEVGRCYGKE